MPVKLGFIILSLIGVLRIPEEFYLYKDKDKEPWTKCYGDTERKFDTIYDELQVEHQSVQTSEEIVTLFICKIDIIGLWKMLFSWHFENWNRQRNLTSKTEKKEEKKSNKSKTKRTKIHTGRGPIIAICFLFLSAYFYVVQYTPSSV